jgi:hypothetical protein
MRLIHAIFILLLALMTFAYAEPPSASPAPEIEGADELADSVPETQPSGIAPLESNEAVCPKFIPHIYFIPPIISFPESSWQSSSGRSISIAIHNPEKCHIEYASIALTIPNGWYFLPNLNKSPVKFDPDKSCYWIRDFGDFKKNDTLESFEINPGPHVLPGNYNLSLYYSIKFRNICSQNIFYKNDSRNLSLEVVNDQKEPQSDKNMSDLVIEAALLIITGLVVLYLWANYENFKKAAIIKSELDGAVTYLREGRPSDRVSIDQGTRFLQSSADSIFGDREYEIKNMYRQIEIFNNEVVNMEYHQRLSNRRSLINTIEGINRQKRMKALPYIGSRKEYFKYKLFLIKLYFSS